MSTTAPDHKKKSLSKGEIVMLVVVVLIFGVVGWQQITVAPAPPKATQLEGPTDIDAYIDAQTIVEKTLKAPSTAKFPSSLDATVERYRDGGFRVSSYVDSQNGFGAMIRSDWSVAFKYTDDEMLDVWQVIVDGQEIYRKPGT